MRIWSRSAYTFVPKCFNFLKMGMSCLLWNNLDCGDLWLPVLAEPDPGIHLVAYPQSRIDMDGKPFIPRLQREVFVFPKFLRVILTQSEPGRFYRVNHVPAHQQERCADPLHFNKFPAGNSLGVHLALDWKTRGLVGSPPCRAERRYHWHIMQKQPPEVVIFEQHVVIDEQHPAVFLG